MTVLLNEEQTLMVNIAREFAVNEVRPRIKDIEEKNEFPYDLYCRMCELGFRDLCIPTEYGGLGESMVTHMAVSEEISKENLMLSILGTANSIAETMIDVCTPQQKEKFLPKYIGGTAMTGLAFSEPTAGSDAAGIQTTAVRDGDYWIINGQKTFISYLKLGADYLVSARTNETGNGGISTFLVENDRPGFEVGSIFHKLGFHGSDTGELFLKNVRVPVINMIGKENKGLHMVFKALDIARMGTAIGAVGLAQGAYEKALAFVKERVQFGRTIASNQGIQWYLAEMETSIQAARALVYEAAHIYDTGLPVTKAAAMAKLNASEMAINVTSRAVQLCGGYGLTNDFGIERYYRDAKVTTLVEGTSEILKIVISRDILK